ncbi:UNVERIFIED_CONTAM: hypothetical protein FKN15_073982 [Acipenser sinensis]
MAMSEEEQDAISIVVSWDGYSFPQEETEVQELTQETDPSSEAQRLVLHLLKLSAGAYGASTKFLQVPRKAMPEQSRCFQNGTGFNPPDFPGVSGFPGGDTVFLAPTGLGAECLKACSDTGFLGSTLLQVSGFQGQALGQSLAGLIVVPDTDKSALLDAPISPGHTFGPAVEEILQRSHQEREAS